jgi:hypothetical protein
MRMNTVELMPRRASAAVRSRSCAMSAPEANAARADEDQDLPLDLEPRAQRVQLVDHALIDRVARRGAVEGRDDAVVVSSMRTAAVGAARGGGWMPRHPPLDDQRGALTDADAHRGEPVAGVFAFEAAEQGDDQARAARAERVAEGDRARRRR